MKYLFKDLNSKEEKVLEVGSYLEAIELGLELGLFPVGEAE